MSEARRTLGCWLLAAFLGRGCDPTTARVPVAIPRVRPLTPAEAAALAARGGNLRVLPRAGSRSEAPAGGPAAESAPRVLPFRRAG